MRPNHLGTALRDYALTELGAASVGLRRRGRFIHAGIHRARKAIRRTRAVLALGTPAVGPAADLIERELRGINRTLSPMRDAHALVQTLDRLTAKASQDASRQLRSLKRSAKARRARLTADPYLAQEISDVLAMLKTLSAAMLGLEWPAITMSTVTDALDVAEKRTNAARALAFASGSDEDWHRWRRRLRTQIQQRRAAAIAGIGTGATLYDKSLAEQMSVMQDLSLLLTHCNRHSDLSKPERKHLRKFAREALLLQRKRIASVS